MAISPEEVKRRLSELSSQGGGIIYGARKSEIDPNSKILVIGIGGLGCKTVNEIAGVYKSDFENQGRLSFMAIDTDDRCFSAISTLNGGNVDQGDMFSIYHPDVSKLLLHPRIPYIKSFVDDAVPPEIITCEGAKQRRAVGKVMLCGGPSYGILYNKLESRINAMSTGSGMQIIIVAGISGGTGSGTFIDISYMVREIAKTANNNNNSVFGVFYTPDVQRNEAWCNDTIWDNLRRNGYASMKELDYFMSVGDGNKVIYSLPLQNSLMINGRSVNVIESTQPIFKREYVFFVSETDTNKTEAGIVHATAVSLLNLFKKSVKLNGKISQNILSNLCNITGFLDTWGNNHIGVLNNPNKSTADPSKMKYTNYPVSMHYSYASFDYKSVYIPCNEMAAYCTNMILNDLLNNKFPNQIQRINDFEVERFAKDCNLDSVDSVYNAVMSLTGWNNINLRIPDDSASYPQAGFMGVKCDASAAVQQARTNVNDAMIGLQGNLDSIWNIFANALSTNLFNNADKWNLYGPYGTIIFMSGTRDGNVKGLIRHIQENLSVEFNNKLQTLQDERNAAETAMNNMKSDLAADNRVTKAEITRMVDLCESYSKKDFEYQLYAQAMPNILNMILANLTELNNRTFATYIPLMQALENIVNEDANRFMHSTLQKNGYGEVFSIDAFNIDNALANSNLFASFFDGYLHNDAVRMAEENLFSILFSKDNRPYWEALTADDGTAAKNAAQKVREIFKDITTPLVGDMLEKFLVMIYCDPATFKNNRRDPNNNGPITLDDLDYFWKNKPQDRDNTLKIAANKILSELNHCNMIKFAVEPGVTNAFDSSIEVVSIPELKNLNAIIESEVKARGGSFSVVEPDAKGNRPKTEISLFKNSGPFPLTFVNRMQDYATRYFISEQSDATAAGRHGDEVTECWQENMPELYGVDADDYFLATRGISPISDDDHPKGNHDRMVFAEVRELCKSALAGGYLYLPEGDTHYKFVVLKKKNYAGNPQLTVDELLVKIHNKLMDMLAGHDLINEDPASLPTWIDAVKALGAEEQHNQFLYLEEHNLDVNVNVVNSTFCAVQSILPEYDYEISNLERLIRMDMSILNEVREEVKFYKDKDFFGKIERGTESIRREQGLKELVGYYLAAYRLGWIILDRGFLVCKSSDGKLDKVILDCRNGFGGLDNELLPFLKLSAFCLSMEKDDIAKKRIQATYAPFQMVDELLGDAQKEAKKKMPDWKNDILNPLRATMESDAYKDYDMDPIYSETFRKFGLSRYQQTYGYPIKVSDGKDIFNNVNKVLAVLDHYVEVGDNTLVPDMD